MIQRLFVRFVRRIAAMFTLVRWVNAAKELRQGNNLLEYIRKYEGSNQDEG